MGASAEVEAPAAPVFPSERGRPGRGSTRCISSGIGLSDAATSATSSTNGCSECRISFDADSGRRTGALEALPSAGMDPAGTEADFQGLQRAKAMLKAIAVAKPNPIAGRVSINQNRRQGEPPSECNPSANRLGNPRSGLRA